MWIFTHFYKLCKFHFLFQTITKFIKPEFLLTIVV